METPKPAGSETTVRNEVPPQPAPAPAQDDGIPKELADLMAANNVTAQDIQQAVAHKGYFPADMPLKDYPQDFVMGCLVAAFPQMLEVIKELKAVPF